MFGDSITNQNTLRIEAERILCLSCIDHGHSTISMIF
jgi:hypothetical protein